MYHTKIARFAGLALLAVIASHGIAHSDPVYVAKTRLLFPFVTNQAGFDTGLAISNTSSNPFGTVPQNNKTCTITWYGSAPPSTNPTKTPTIAAGTTYTFLVSTTAPGFQGYVTVACNFGFGEGFAFISELGARSSATSYLAKVLPLETPLLSNELSTTPSSQGQ